MSQSTSQPEVDAINAALAESEASKSLLGATTRLGKLLGINIMAASNASKTKTTVALAILTEPKAVVVTTSGTKAGAAQNAADWLNRMSDAIEQRLSQRIAPRIPTEQKSLPEQKHTPPQVKKIGSTQ